MLYLGLALAGVYVVVMAPILGLYTESGQGVTQLSEQLARYRRVAQAAPRVQASLEEIRVLQSASDYYLKSDRASLASAELQQAVKSVINASGATLVSSQTVRREGAGGLLPEVAIKVHMRGDIDSLREVLHELEGGQPVLVLDDVFITASPARRYARNQGRKGAETLDVRFKVIGYLRRGEGV
jgi:general secretion pathway protein M